MTVEIFIHSLSVISDLPETFPATCSVLISYPLGSLTGAPDKVIQRVNPTTDIFA